MEHSFKKEEGTFKVDRIPYSEAKEWVLCKHYAHRIPSICYAFWLYEVQQGGLTPCLCGVCTFGSPPSQDLIIGAMGIEYKDNFLELNRLVVNDGLPMNALSYFVSQCLKMLPRPMVVISYADSGQGHHGYIYQATNWIYTGLSKPHTDYLPEGKEGMHVRTLYDNFSIKTTKLKMVKVERTQKYRYFKFLGDKRQVKKMMKDLKFEIIKSYPKGDNRRYDASYETHPNGLLFDL